MNYEVDGRIVNLKWVRAELEKLKQDREVWCDAEHDAKVEEWDIENGDDLNRMTRFLDDVPAGLEYCVHNDYFLQYVEDYAYDTGAVGEDSWIANYIDWEKAASDLQLNYTYFKFDDTEYWCR